MPRDPFDSIDHQHTVEQKRNKHLAPNRIAGVCSPHGEPETVTAATSHLRGRDPRRGGNRGSALADQADLGAPARPRLARLRGPVGGVADRDVLEVAGERAR